jgi:hypothetical protein
MKVCARCSLSKEFSFFGKDKQTKSGLDCYCKVCKRIKGSEWKQKNKAQHLDFQKRYREANRQKLRNYNKQYDRLNKDKVRSQDLKSKYGITLDQYKILFVQQNGSCKICAALPKIKALAVDHCHKTGKVRGLLCGLCNRGLGMFKDNTILLYKAADYLEQK